MNKKIKIWLFTLILFNLSHRGAVAMESDPDLISEDTPQSSTSKKPLITDANKKRKAEANEEHQDLQIGGEKRKKEGPEIIQSYEVILNKKLYTILIEFDNELMHPDQNIDNGLQIFSKKLMIKGEKCDIQKEKIQDWWIKKLEFTATPIKDEGLPYLISGNFLNLTSLSLHDQKISNNGIFSLVKCDNFKSNLTYLDLSRNDIRVKGAEEIATKFSNLKILKLYDNKIGDSGLLKIANGSLTKLESVDLYKNNISDQGLFSLSNRNNLPNLKILNLSNNWNIQNQISYEGLKILINGNNLPKLKIVDLRENCINKLEQEEINKSKEKGINIIFKNTKK